MAKILLITYFFPPHNSIPCRRVYAFAKFLKRLGHDIFVVTAESPGDTLVKSFDVDTSSFFVVHVPYFDILNIIFQIYKPKDILKKKMQTKSGRLSLADIFFRLLLRINGWVSQRGILFGCTRFPTAFELWFFKAYRVACGIIQKENIDIIITSAPPHTASVVGYFLKKRFPKIVWVSDLRDLWVDNPVHRGLFPFTILEKIFERKSIASSDIVVTVSDILKEKLVKKYPDKQRSVYCIENGYDTELLMCAQERKNRLPDTPRTLVYGGTLYEGRRDPEIIFSVLKENHNMFSGKVEVIFYGNIQTKNIIGKLLMQYPDICSLVRYGGFLSASCMAHEYSAADSLLFLEDDSDNGGVLTGKIFEYIYFRKPICCVGIMADSYVGGFLKKTGLCFFCEKSKEKIKAFLECFIYDKLHLLPDEQYISQFTREKQIAKFDKIIKGHLT